jgi:hypothetical protein
MSRKSRTEGSVESSPRTPRTPRTSVNSCVEDKEEPQFKSPVRRASKALRKSFQALTSPLRKGHAEEGEDEEQPQSGKSIEEMDQDMVLLLLCREFELIGED